MLKRSFAAHGIPATVRTGNGPQLVSEESKECARVEVQSHYFFTVLSPKQWQGGISRKNREVSTSESEEGWKRYLALFIGMAKCSDAGIRLVAMSTLDVIKNSIASTSKKFSA